MKNVNQRFRLSSGLMLGLVLLFVIAETILPKSANQRLRPSTVFDGQRERIAAAYDRLPMRFEANQGQTDTAVKFLARGRSYTLSLTANEAALQLRNSVALRLKLAGANPGPSLAGLNELPGKIHYFIGNDAVRWRTNVTSYARVERQEVYPGINLVYYGAQQQLEYDFIVAPGADPSQIRMSFAGADRIEVDARGDLVLDVAGGRVYQRAPVVYQEVNGERRTIYGRYVIWNPQSAIGNQTVGIELGEYDPARPLVIDPVLDYSTYFGGTTADLGASIAVDAAGNAYIAGQAFSIDIPTRNAIQGNRGFIDAFVAKFNPAGTDLIYSTYLGGGVADHGYGIAIDSAGNAYVTGAANSFDFPVRNALQPASGGGADAFIAKLTALGELVYSTYLGGSGADTGQSIAADSAGNVYIAGQTNSLDFPTRNPLQGTNRGGTDAFVVKLNPAGNGAGSDLVYATYLGGGATDQAWCVAVDSAGSVYVAGETGSTDFPTRNPLQSERRGASDAFAVKLNAAGGDLVYSTYLGGGGADKASGLALNSSGNAYLTGQTASTDFPTRNPFQASNGGGEDAFVTQLNAAGSDLVYATYIGGNGVDTGQAVTVDVMGNAFVTGYTESGNFPTRDPLPMSNLGAGDAFVLKLNPTGNDLVFSTYLGGSGVDVGAGIAADAAGNAYVIGRTASTDFPTVQPFQSENFGGNEAFIVKLSAGGGTVAQDYEADVAPRGSPNGQLTIADWVLAGRFATGIETAIVGTEFQRADCSPKETLGDGRISIADWVQAGRYAAGLDPIVRAGGPTMPAGQLSAIDGWLQYVDGQRRSMPDDRQRAAVAERVTIEINASGNENAFAFSLDYNPRLLRFIGVDLTPETNGASMAVNTAQIARGQVGFALALPAGQQFAAGVRTLMTIRFITTDGAPAGGRINFGDSPIRREMADADARVIDSAGLELNGSGRIHRNDRR